MTGEERDVVLVTADGGEALYGDVLDRSDSITQKMAAVGIPPERVARGRARAHGAAPEARRRGGPRREAPDRA